MGRWFFFLKADGKITEMSLQLQSSNQWNDGSAMF